MTGRVVTPVTTLFPVWHNVTGSALAAHWMRRDGRP